ncbi:hypothetical protein UFOVP726_41 [uncultured Caudovirales phage]|uniref:Uncharacterized protein n=1 Tax=uncultured Caudovirales phage TaxID=2100421 RepID=A0A6J5NLM9_9CAUD|nr:hypothetical protein UFOVP726_41 [uncultured Caudovirales phage]
MYDEPQDPEPNPCIFCDEELGTNEDCEHCRLASKLSETESALSTLKHKLGCRARNLAWLPAGAEFAARRAEAVALLLDVAGLKLPADYLAQAKASMTGEYGEHPPIGKNGGRTDDEAIVDRFMQFACAESAAASPAFFSGEILSAKPATRGDQLWWGKDANGAPRIFTEAEKRQGRWGGGGSTQWGLTLRECIEKALDSEARNAEFWLEFFRDYIAPPKDLVPPHDPRRVRGGSQPKVSFVVGTTAYTAYVGKHKSEHDRGQHLGFGGAEFAVLLDDGREFFTDNNWHRGEVPPHLRKLLRSNAVFVKKAAAATTEQPATV